MNNNSGSSDLAEAGKCRRHVEDTTTDRLSNLPEPILYHILSFLDTKSVVETSVLSRAWRCAWKHVPVLDLRSFQFEQYSSFQRFVDTVLSLRYPLTLHRVSLVDRETSEERECSLFVRVIEYALHHDAQHLAIDLEDDLEIENTYELSFAGVLDCNLESLALKYVTLDPGLGSSGFRPLTDLKLDSCRLFSDGDEELIDPFSNFPCLKNLVIRNCCRQLGHLRGKVMKISGLQLLSLKLENTRFHQIEIFAPKLKFFGIRDRGSILDFLRFNLPSLDHADIKVTIVQSFFEHSREWVEQHVISLLQGLHNAKSLTLHYRTIQVLSKISEFLGRQPSPFTRLECLNLLSSSVPPEVANYFLKGSSGRKPPKIEFFKNI